MNFPVHEKSLIAAILLVVAFVFPQPSTAQVAVEKKAQADDIPSTRQALNGRLFFSREQRARLDRLRNGGDTITGDVLNSPLPSQINGFVKRSDGEAAVWVDQRAQYKVPREYAERIRPQDVGGAAGKLKILSGSMVASPAVDANRGK